MQNSKTIFGIAVVAACVSQTTQAQIQSDGSLPGRNKFDTVEVLAKSPSDSELRKRSVVAKQIYGREELDRFGDTNLADSMANLPGVRVINGAASLSGMDPKYTKILFNGDPAPAGVTLDQISPGLIERVEITRGQTASQSAQSIAGTINIIFKDAPRKTQNSVRLGAQYQNERPTPNATYTYGGKAGDLSYILPITVNELLQTYQVNSEKRFTDQSGAQNLGYQERYWRYRLSQLTFAPRLNYAINDDEKLASSTFIQVAQRGLKHRYARSVLQGDPQLNDDFDSNTLYRILRTDLSWSKNLDADARVEVKAGYNTSHYMGSSNLSRDEQARSDKNEDEVENTARLGAKYQRLIGKGHAITFGADSSRQKNYQWANERYLGTLDNPLVAGSTFEGSIDTNAVYLEDEWEVDQSLAFNFGLRAEQMNLGVVVPQQIGSVQSYAGSTPSSVYMTNPILHFRYKPANGEQLIRGSISRGYKAPDMDALMVVPYIVYRDTTVTNSAAAPDTVGNSAIRPELATGVDLAVETQFGRGGVFTVGAFYRDIDDIVMNVTSLRSVYWATAPRWVTQPVNFSHGASYGVEIEMRSPAGLLLPAAWTPARPLNVRLNLNLYGSRVDAVDGPNNRLPQQSPWNATLGFDYKPSDALTLGASMYVTPSYVRQGPLTADVSTQEQLRWINAFAQYKIDQKSSLRIGLNNLFPVANATEVATAFSDLKSNRTGRTALAVTYEAQLK